jgi:hypothetical protein
MPWNSSSNRLAERRLLSLSGRKSMVERTSERLRRRRRRKRSLSSNEIY